MEYKLYNRYGDNLYLKEIAENTFELVGGLDWMRIIYNATNTNVIDAIDPSGGPYMEVNHFTIYPGGKILKEIREIVDDTTHTVGRYELIF